MYSQINIKSKIKDYSVSFVDLNEIYKFIGEDFYLTVVDKNVANCFPELVLNDTIVVDTNEDLKSWYGLEKIFVNSK